MKRAKDDRKHLHGDAFGTECGLSSMKAGMRMVRAEARSTCDDCKRIRRERHEHKMATDAAYRRNYEQVAAFAALGIKVGKWGPISMSAAEADKVLRRLRTAVRRG